MSSIAEVNSLINSLIVDNSTGLVSPLKVRQALLAITSAITQTNLSTVTANSPLNYDTFNNLFTAIKADATHDGFLSLEDWNLFNTMSGGLQVATAFRFIQKGFGNSDLENYEIGDIFCGWRNDGGSYYSSAEYLGGILTNSDNFKALTYSQGNLKISSKLPGNSQQTVIEVGDVVYGLLNNNTTFIPFGQYLGGDIQLESSYNCSPIEFSL